MGKKEGIGDLNSHIMGLPLILLTPWLMVSQCATVMHSISTNLMT
jgi:hypothetical protein